MDNKWISNGQYAIVPSSLIFWCLHGASSFIRHLTVFSYNFKNLCVYYVVFLSHSPSLGSIGVDLISHV